MNIYLNANNFIYPYSFVEASLNIYTHTHRHIYENDIPSYIIVRLRYSTNEIVKRSIMTYTLP